MKKSLPHHRTPRPHISRPKMSAKGHTAFAHGMPHAFDGPPPDQAFPTDGGAGGSGLPMPPGGGAMPPPDAGAASAPMPAGPPQG